MEERQRRRHTSDQQSWASGVSIAKSLWKRVKEKKHRGFFLGENIIWKEVWKQWGIKKLSGIWAGGEKQWHFNCFLRDLALSVDFRPAPAFIMMHFSPPKQFLALVDVGTMPPSPPPFFSLRPPPLNLPLSPPPSHSGPRSLGLAQMGESSRCFIRPFFLLFFAFFFPLPVFSLLFSHLLVSPAAEWI